MTHRATSRFVAIATLLVAGVATIATQPAVPRASSEEVFTVPLGPDSPVDFRRVALTIANAGNTPTGAEFSVGPADYEHDFSGYRVDLIPVDPGEERPDMYEDVYNSAMYLGVGWTSVYLDLADRCLTDCTLSYWILTRLADPSALPIEAELSARAHASYQGEGGDPPPGARAEIDVASFAEDMTLATIRATASGQAVVSTDTGWAVWRGVLKVSSNALLAQSHSRSVGSAWLTMTAMPSNDDARASSDVKVAGEPLLNELLDSDWTRSQQVVEWLSVCEVGTECEVPIELEFTWHPWEGDPAQPRPIGSVTIDWTLETTLEYINLDAPPDGARLELVEQ